MAKRIITFIMCIITVFMISCKRSIDDETSDFKDDYNGSNTLGVYHGIEAYADFPLVFIGEFTGYILKNIDGYYYPELHVLEKIKGNVDDYILMYNYFLQGIADSVDNNIDFPFQNGEKYLFVTSKTKNIYYGEFCHQGVLFCPVERYEDSFMIVLGEKKSLDFMTKGSKDDFKDFDSFLSYLKKLIEKSEAKQESFLLFTESDNIYDILTESPQILKVKVIHKSNNLDNEYFSDYFCRVEKVYKGDYDPERGNLICLKDNGETRIRRPSNHRKHYFDFRLFNSDIDLKKTDEYIICNNSTYLIARKGVISLDYTEEEIINMLNEIYGEVNILEIPEENAVNQ